MSNSLREGFILEDNQRDIFGKADVYSNDVYSDSETYSNRSKMNYVDSDSENHSISLLKSILAELSEIKKCICPGPYIPPPIPDDARNMYTGGSSRRRKTRRRKTRRRKTRRKKTHRKSRRKTRRKRTRKR